MVNSKSWLLTELSRETLKSYADRASSSLDQLPKKKMGKRAHSVVRTNTKLMTQEANDLTELSKTTLKRYINKSSDAADHINKGNEREGPDGKLRPDQERGPLRKAMDRFNTEDPQRHQVSKEISGLKKKLQNRRQGMITALRKMPDANEEVDLQELSSTKLRDYLVKANETEPKAKKHKKGIVKAFGRWIQQKESEELTELSKKTLLRYIDQSSGNAISRGRYLERDITKNNEHQWSHEADRDEKKIDKRHQGIMRAAKRLAKEDTDLQEVSKETLGRYITRSADNFAFTQKRGGDYHRRQANKEFIHGKSMEIVNQHHDAADSHYHKVDKRRQGIDLAVRKITKSKYAKVHAEAKEDLKEVARHTLMSYVRKAGDDVEDQKWRMKMAKDHSGLKDSSRRITKRVNGITLAAQKLGKNWLRVGPTKE